MSDSKARPSERPMVRSDPPPEDLRRERDTFIQQFFRRGAQLSEELLGDIERLRMQVRTLEADNAALRTQLASDTAIRDLLHKIEALEAEKRTLIATSLRPPAPEDEFAERFAELEAELAQLGTLHVANVQLHSSSTLRRAFRSIRDLLGQFLGAAQFAVYWEADDATLVPISVEGVTQREAGEFAIEESAAKAAYQRGQMWVDDGVEASQGSVQRPAAVIPLSMLSERLGAVVIFKTLSQKDKFLPADFGLFKLLSTQAAPAIVHAHLFAQAGRRAPQVQSLIDQED